MKLTEALEQPTSLMPSAYAKGECGCLVFVMHSPQLETYAVHTFGCNSHESSESVHDLAPIYERLGVTADWTGWNQIVVVDLIGALGGLHHD